MEFCFAFRQQCAWYNDKEFVKLSVERGIHIIKGPANMSSFYRHQMAMGSVSWCLYWEKRHEFDHWPVSQMASRIHSTFDWLAYSGRCDSVYADLNSKQGSKPNYISELARLSQESSGIVKSAACSMNLAQ